MSVSENDLNSSMESLLQFERQLFHKIKQSKYVVTSKATASSFTSSTSSVSPRKRPTLEKSSTLKIMRSDATTISSGTSNPIVAPVIPLTASQAPNVFSSTFNSTKPRVSSKTSNYHDTTIGASNGTLIAKEISQPKVTVAPTVLKQPTVSGVVSTVVTSKHLPKPTKKHQSSITALAYELFRTAVGSTSMLVPEQTKDSSLIIRFDNNNEVSNLAIKQEQLNSQPVTPSNAQQNRPSHQYSRPETISFSMNDINIEDISSRLSENEIYTFSKGDLMKLLQAFNKSTNRELGPSSQSNPVVPCPSSVNSKSNFKIFITFTQIYHYMMSFHDENNRPQFDLFLAELSEILLADRQLTCSIGNVYYVHSPTGILVRVFRHTSLVKLFTDQSVYLCEVRHPNGTNVNKADSVDVFLRLIPKTVK